MGKIDKNILVFAFVIICSLLIVAEIVSNVLGLIIS